MLHSTQVHTETVGNKHGQCGGKYRSSQRIDDEMIGTKLLSSGEIFSYDNMMCSCLLYCVGALWSSYCSSNVCACLTSQLARKMADTTRSSGDQDVVVEQKATFFQRIQGCQSGSGERCGLSKADLSGNFRQPFRGNGGSLRPGASTNVEQPSYHA